MQSDTSPSGDGKIRTRLFVASPLQDNGTVALDAAQAHKLAHVLRASVGQRARLFNGRDGEWLGEITNISKKNADIKLIEQTHPQHAEHGPRLCFAPLKKTRLDILIEKSVEMGAARLSPVLLEHCENRKPNLDRLQAQIIEASEQCERLSVPELDAPVTLGALLGSLNADTPAFVALERSDATALKTALQTAIANGVNTPIFLIGPEGGFSPTERDMLKRCDYVTAVNLGPRILRAETAAMAVLSGWQLLHDDDPQQPENGPRT